MELSMNGEGLAMQSMDGTGSSVTTCVAPLRIALAGGGTDLPSFADRYGGDVISFAIDRCVAVACFPRAFDTSIQARFNVVDAAGALLDGNRLATALTQRYDWWQGLQLASMSDVPGGTGLGSSASFGVALLHALCLAHAAPISPRLLAEEAAFAEMAVLRRPVGKHDHYIAAYGGMQRLIITSAGVEVQPLSVDDALIEFINRRMLLFYTGGSRDAGQVLAAQDSSTRDGDQAVTESLLAIKSLVPEMLKALADGAVDDIGPIFHAHWHRKKSLAAGISSAAIDRAYSAALEAGATGGKVVGAGGGGFLLLCCGRGCEDDVRSAMAGHGMPETSFSFRATGSSGTSLAL